MLLTEIEILPFITRLAELVSQNIDNPSVVAAFRTVPRHRFVMRDFHVVDEETHQLKPITLENMDSETWLNLVYANRVLMIEPGHTGAPSSSSEPVLMAQMLAALDIQTGMRVLEIGTGTGYNAALLATLVDEAGQAVTIDNQAHLTAQAAIVLKEIVGERVSVQTGDGLLGVPDAAPYDRIIATAKHSRVPAAWLEQLAIGGKLIMNVGDGGSLLLLQKTATGAQGHFLEEAGYFMPLLEVQEQREQIVADIDMDSLHSADFRYFASWAMPDVIFYAIDAKPEQVQTEGNLHFRSADETHIVQLIADGQQTKLVTLQGDDTFAEMIIGIIRQWHTSGKPDRSAYQFTIEADGRQIVRLADIQFEL